MNIKTTVSIAAIAMVAVAAGSVLINDFTTTTTNNTAAVTTDLAAQIVDMPTMTIHADPVDQVYYRAYRQAQSQPVVNFPVITVYADQSDLAYVLAEVALNAVASK